MFLILGHHFLSKDSAYTDIFLNQLIQFYSNNATNLHHLTTYSTAALPHKMAIVLRPQICDVPSPYVYQCTTVLKCWRRWFHISDSGRIQRWSYRNESRVRWAATRRWWQFSSLSVMRLQRLWASRQHGRAAPPPGHTLPPPAPADHIIDIKAGESNRDIAWQRSRSLRLT